MSDEISYLSSDALISLIDTKIKLINIRKIFDQETREKCKEKYTYVLIDDINQYVIVGFNKNGDIVRPEPNEEVPITLSAAASFHIFQNFILGKLTLNQIFYGGIVKIDSEQPMRDKGNFELLNEGFRQVSSV